MLKKPVFIHCQTFSRKRNRIGQCVAQVIAEGLRRGAFHSHVENPQPPRVIFGDPTNFQSLHDAHVAARRTRVSLRGIQFEKKIRVDRHTLFTIIASYPELRRDVAGDPVKATEHAAWEGATVAWVQSLYGDELKAVFAHEDEVYPHLHFWLLPDHPSGDAARIHPGKAAKRKTEARLKGEGVAPREAVKAGNIALKEAMRGWIDGYHRAVAPLGLTRDGPKRRRLSRAQYRAETAMAAHHRALADDRAQLQAEIAALETQRLASEARILDLDATARRYAHAAEQFQDRLKARAREIDAAGPLLDAIVTEIDQRTIVYENGVWHVQDPHPFQEAPLVWKKLRPVVLRLMGLIKDAEDGRAEAERLVRVADRRLAYHEHLVALDAIDLESPPDCPHPGLEECGEPYLSC